MRGPHTVDLEQWRKERDEANEAVKLAVASYRWWSWSSLVIAYRLGLQRFRQAWRGKLS